MQRYMLNSLDLVTLAIKIENERREKSLIENRQQETKVISSYLTSQKEIFEKASKGDFISCQDLFSNPIVETIKEVYGFALEDYKVSGRTKVTDFTSDIHTGIEMIIEEVERFRDNPKSFKAIDYNLLRDICFKINEWNHNLDDSNLIHRLAA